LLCPPPLPPNKQKYVHKRQKDDQGTHFISGDGEEKETENPKAFADRHSIQPCLAYIVIEAQRSREKKKIVPFSLSFSVCLCVANCCVVYFWSPFPLLFGRLCWGRLFLIVPLSHWLFNKNSFTPIKNLFQIPCKTLKSVFSVKISVNENHENGKMENEEKALPQENEERRLVFTYRGRRFSFRPVSFRRVCVIQRDRIRIRG
jgi:hypothetical protein